MLCNKTWRVFRKYFYLLNMLEECLYPKLSLKGRNWVVGMKRSPSSVVGVYINNAIWLAQNFFVYFKDCLLYSKYFFLHLVQLTKYTILICTVQTESSFLFCVNLQSMEMIKHVLTCLNLFLSYTKRKWKKKNQALSSSLKLSQQFLKDASLYFPKYVITICIFFI